MIKRGLNGLEAALPARSPFGAKPVTPIGAIH